MAGPWDQFPDAPPAASPAADPWAAFPDAQPAAPAAASAPVVPAKQPSAKPNAVVDTVGGFLSGVPRGLAETIMLPETVNRLGEQGVGWVMDRGEDALRSALGLAPVSDAERQRRQQMMNSVPTLDRALARGQDAVRGYMDDNLYKPQTTPGRFAETVGEFVAPGGVPSKSARLAPTLARKAGEYAADLTRGALVPGVASEAAGEALAGTPYEPVARVIGAVGGNLATGLAKSATAPEMVLRRAAGPADEIDWPRAVGLQDNPTGIKLTGPEAITQAQGGASALPNLQRVVEGSVEGRARTAPFFAKRPEQVDTAVNTVLDQIAPQSPNPSTLGPRAADVATTAIRDVEKQRTAAVDPIYQAANADTVPTDAVSGVISRIDEIMAGDKTGVLSAPLKDLRNRLIAEPAKPGVPSTREPGGLTPEGKPSFYRTTDAVEPVPEVPITDIENLDRTRKYFRDRMDLPQIGQDAITKEQNGAISSILDHLDNLMETHSANFARGKQTYADITRNTVDPVTQGPLGQVAAAKDTKAAGNALLPQNPLVGSEGETADAVRRMAEQDPDGTRALVRQIFGDRYAKAATETQQGSREFAGAKFNKDVAGNAPRQAALDAVLGALPDKAAATAMPELLDVLEATGRRMPIGSATEFNRSLNADLGVSSPMARVIDTAKTLGTSLVTNAGDAVKRAAMRRSLNTLADMFTDPQSVELIQQAIARGAPSVFPEVGARTAAQMAPVMSGSKGKRK